MDYFRLNLVKIDEDCDRLPVGKCSQCKHFNSDFCNKYNMITKGYQDGCKAFPFENKKEKGVVMDKNESLAILGSACKSMESMSEEQLFDYMMSNSETFRKHNV